MKENTGEKKNQNLGKSEKNYIGKTLSITLTLYICTVLKRHNSDCTALIKYQTPPIQTVLLSLCLMFVFCSPDHT